VGCVSAHPPHDGVSSRSVSRVLYPGGAGAVTISLGPTLPAGSCDQPGDWPGALSPSIWSCSRWGLHGRRVTTPPVRSYRTISPLPARDGRYVSVALSVGSPPLGVTQHLRPVELGLSSPRCRAAVTQPAGRAYYRAAQQFGGRVASTSERSLFQGWPPADSALRADPTHPFCFFSGLHPCILRWHHRCLRVGMFSTEIASMRLRRTGQADSRPWSREAVSQRGRPVLLLRQSPNSCQGERARICKAGRVWSMWRRGG
jgi:hypothetical protein